MTEDVKDKLSALAKKTRDQFNLYAAFDQADFEVVKANGIFLMETYGDLVDRLAVPEDLAADQEQGMRYMADYCDQQGDVSTALLLRECADITRDIRHEMALPENVCPTPGIVQSATGAVLARYKAPKLDQI